VCDTNKKQKERLAQQKGNKKKTNYIQRGSISEVWVMLLFGCLMDVRYQ